MSSTCRHYGNAVAGTWCFGMRRGRRGGLDECRQVLHHVCEETYAKPAQHDVPLHRTIRLPTIAQRQQRFLRLSMAANPPRHITTPLRTVGGTTDTEVTGSTVTGRRKPRTISGTTTVFTWRI